MHTAPILSKIWSGKLPRELTFKIFSTLPLFAWFAYNLDRSTWKYANDSLRFVIRRGGSYLDQCLYLFLLLVDIRDEKLLPNTAANIGGSCGRVRDIEGLAR